jgi:hypothetical protein
MIVPVRRVVVTSLALVGLVTCGVTVAEAGSGAATTTTTTTITKPEALDFARAVNLQTSDLPGSAPLRGDFGPPGPPAPAAELQRRDLQCGHRGRARGRAIVAEGSLFFDRYMEPLGSIIFVMPSEALAAAEVAALPSRSGHACLAHFVRSRFALVAGAPEGASYAIKLTWVPVEKLLGRRAVALHMLAKLLPRRSRFAYVAEVIFRVGAADILFGVQSERRRFPAATERRLLSLLYSRAKAHKL